MKIIIIICLIVFYANAFTIVDASFQSGFMASFAQLEQALQLPWMKMAFTDLLTGFLLVSVWILYREKNNYLVSIPLVILYCFFLGNILLATYIAVILIRNGGDIEELLIGKRAT